MEPTMHRLNVLGVSLFTVSLVACVSEISAEGAAVKIGKLDPESGCTELGTVYGSGGGGPYTSSEDKMRSAQNELRNHTAELGGNYVAMDVAGGDVHGMTLTGRAFRCNGKPTTALNAAPATVPLAAAPTPEERLTKLKELLDKGLITQDEYDKRRAEIIHSL
jgi:hypothetical protein